MLDSHPPLSTVLLVDDEYIPRSLESIALEGTGRYRTIVAGNASDALAVLGSQDCDCAVIDYAMPDMSGLELVRLIRNSRGYGDLRVVLVLPEGSDTEDTGLRFPAVDRVLAKPLNPWELARAVDRLTNTRSNADTVLSVEALLHGFPYPAMIIDSQHQVVLANGSFYENTGTGIGSCYVHCMQHMHSDERIPRECPLEQCLRTNRPTEQLVSTILGDVRVAVYPLATTVGDRDRLYLHVTQPLR